MTVKGFSILHKMVALAALVPVVSTCTQQEPNATLLPQPTASAAAAPSQEAPSQAPSLPLPAEPAPTVIFVGTSFLSQISVAMLELFDNRNVAAALPRGITDYTDVSLFNWRQAYSDMFEKYDPDVMVVHVPFPPAPECFRLTTAADTEMCVELNRERYLYPVLDGMMRFFIDKGVAAVFVGTPATGLRDGVLSDVGIHKGANELTRLLNAALRERVTAAGFAFFDPADVLGHSYTVYREVDGGWEQWQFGKGDVHLCPPAAVAAVAKLDELIIGAARSPTRDGVNRLWSVFVQNDWPCARGLLTADQLSRDGLLAEYRPAWR